MPNPKPSTYADLVQVLDDLPVAVRSVRRARRLSQRDVGALTALSYSTICRVEAGEEYSSTSLRALLLWLDADPAAAGEVQS